MTEPRTFLDGRVTLFHDDCREVLRGMADNSVDSVVTDPPYHLHSGGRRGMAGADGSFAPSGFMGKQWDGGDIAFQPELWAEVLRVLKPGGYIMAFSGCRTYHRMACAIEDAGFITHPFFAWATGQGFPKAHSLEKQLHDKICRCERTESTAKCDLRSMRNADVSASGRIEEERDEILFDGLPKQGLPLVWEEPSQESIRIEEPGLEGWSDISESSRKLREREIRSMPSRPIVNGESGWVCDGAPPCNGEVVSASIDANGMRSSRRSQSTEQCKKEFDAVARQPEPQERGAWPLCGRCGKPIVDANGWFYGTQACKPALEPVYFGQKPFERGLNGAQNVLKWGVGAINVAGCKIGAEARINNPASSDGDVKVLQRREIPPDPTSVIGRWPANLLTDGSDEVLACFPETGAHSTVGRTGPVGGHGGDVRLCASKDADKYIGNWPADEGGSAARFFASFPQEDVQRIFYTSKADADDRLASKHPTVKPLSLLQYLVRLITPRGGTCLDLFAGTGTTAEACFREGFRCILIEREDEYIKDIERRLSLVMEGQDTRKYASMKARNRPRDDGPLFGGSENDNENASTF